MQNSDVEGQVGALEVIITVRVRLLLEESTQSQLSGCVSACSSVCISFRPQWFGNEVILQYNTRKLSHTNNGDK